MKNTLRYNCHLYNSNTGDTTSKPYITLRDVIDLIVRLEAYDELTIKVDEVDSGEL